MVGGDDEPVQRLEPIFKSLAPEDGYAHVGASGAGHFTKMVHNGIEYGLMQAYAEGFEIIEHSEFDVDLHELSGIWRYGSVVRSWLLELLHTAFEEHGNKLDDIAPYVEDSGEGRWTIHEAIAENVPAPVISAALFARFASRDEINFAAKVAAALRNQFGGHAIKAMAKAEARRRIRGRTDATTAENPLEEGLSLRRTPDPCALVIFGASGDLTHKKLMPALYALMVRRLLPPRFAIVGVARTEGDDDAFRDGHEGGGAEARARRVPRRRLGRARRRTCTTSRPTSPTRAARTSSSSSLERARQGAATSAATASTTSPCRRPRSRRSSRRSASGGPTRRAGRA